MAEPLTTHAFEFQTIKFWIKDLGNDRPGIDSEYSQESARLTLTYRVDYAVRKEARRALLGYTWFRLTAPPEKSYLTRQMPHCYEREENWLWCSRAKILPEIARESPGNGEPGALYAEIQATYEPRSYDLKEDTDMTLTPEGFVDESTFERFVSFPPPTSKDRVLTSAVGTWRFTDRERAIPVGIGVVVNDTEEVVIWHQVPTANIPRTAIAACYAKTNDAAFLGRAAGSMVLSKYTYKELPRLSDGTLAVDVIYTFTRKPFGANFFPDPDRGNLHVAVVAFDGSGRLPYPAADFKTLFRPQAP